MAAYLHARVKLELKPNLTMDPISLWASTDLPILKKVIR
jgi:hypothetical protein